jgi:hypothetical protein
MYRKFIDKLCNIDQAQDSDSDNVLINSFTDVNNCNINNVCIYSDKFFANSSVNIHNDLSIAKGFDGNLMASHGDIQFEGN